MVHLYLHCLSCCKASTPRMKSRLSVTFLGITFHKHVHRVLLFSSKTAHNFENTVYQCFRTRVPENKVTDLAGKSGTNTYVKIFLNTSKNSKYPLKYRRNFCPTICNIRIISVRYQLCLCCLVRKRFYRHAFLRIGNVILGVRQCKKVYETIPHTRTFVSYFVHLKNPTLRSEKKKYIAER